MDSPRRREASYIRSKKKSMLGDALARSFLECTLHGAYSTYCLAWRLIANTHKPYREARLVDPKTGSDVPSGEEGELWIRGPSVMMWAFTKYRFRSQVLIKLAGAMLPTKRRQNRLSRMDGSEPGTSWEWTRIRTFGWLIGLKRYFISFLIRRFCSY